MGNTMEPTAENRPPLWTETESWKHYQADDLAHYVRELIDQTPEPVEIRITPRAVGGWDVTASYEEEV